MTRLVVGHDPFAPFGVSPARPRQLGGAVPRLPTSGLPQRTSGARALPIRAADKSPFAKNDLWTLSGSATKWPAASPPITWVSEKEACRHLNGLSPTSPGVAESRSAGRTLFADCFTGSRDAKDALGGRALKFPEDHDVASSILALEHRVCADVSRRGVVGSGDNVGTIEVSRSSGRGRPSFG